MRPGHYEAAQQRLDRITIKCGYLHDEFRSFSLPPTKVILLDHMDWLDEKSIRSEWSIFKDYTVLDCKFLWRSFGRGQKIGCLEWLKFELRFTLDLKQGGSPFSDRVGSYNSTFVASIPRDVSFGPLVNFAPPLTLTQRLLTFVRMMTFPLIPKSKNTNLMDQFYKTQAKDYDAYRRFMLHGKKELVECVPFKRNMRILALGGGTGDIVEHFKDYMQHISHVTIVDLSHHLLQVAQDRIKQNNWTARVVTVEADATKFRLHDDDEPFDLVIITYALTMISDWKATLEVARDCLGECGLLAVADFTNAPTSSVVHQRFWRYVFRHDHVHLNHLQIETMDSMFEPSVLRYGRGGFPFVPLLRADFYWGVWRKKVLSA